MILILMNKGGMTHLFGSIINVFVWRICTWMTLFSGGTLLVNHTLPPMIASLPIVMRPKIVAPAYMTTSSPTMG